MTSFQSSHSIIHPHSIEPRRSHRKKTKKIFKDHFPLPNPFTQKLKKHQPLPPRILNSQITKIQFLAQKALSTLNYPTQGFSIQMLNDMKEAVNQQQLKLYQFLSIKLTAEKNLQENQILQNLSKIAQLTQQKKNTPKIYPNTIKGDCPNYAQISKQGIAMTTEQEIYEQFWQVDLHVQSSICGFTEQKEFYLAQVPRFRKESSKLLSDNYENNELLYTIEQLVPNWDGQEVQQHSGVQFQE